MDEADGESVHGTNWTRESSPPRRKARKRIEKVAWDDKVGEVILPLQYLCQEKKQVSLDVHYDILNLQSHHHSIPKRLTERIFGTK